METILFNEKELTERLIVGDKVAFEALYHHYSAPLLASLIRLVKSKSLAGELLQDTFIKIWERRQLTDPNQPFRPWLFTIARNLVYDYFRKASRDKKLHNTLLQLATDYFVHVEEAVLNKEIADQLREAIDALPPQRRQVFRLCREEGKTYEEVSRLLDISTSTISDHIVKANRFLQQQLRQHRIMALSLAWLLLSFHGKF
mgnify:CR=1 FL=1